MGDAAKCGMASTPQPSFRQKFLSLWQPRRGLFWLMLAFNLLSSGMGWTLHLLQPTGVLLVVLTLMALGNTLIGWWLLSILWRDGAAVQTQGDN